MARRDGHGVRLYTRNGYDFAGRFPQIAASESRDTSLSGRSV
jgi:ATP-dependent DNA ligase